MNREQQEYSVAELEWVLGTLRKITDVAERNLFFPSRTTTLEQLRQAILFLAADIQNLREQLGNPKNS